MSYRPALPLLSRWSDVPICMIDFETTGIRVGADRAVSIGMVRFERGAPSASVYSLIDPGMLIPAEAIEVHGISNADVAGAPTIEEFCASEAVQDALRDAQPAAYNAPFDKSFFPPSALPDYTWPWLDALTFVRRVDRYARGKGRHKLTAVCERHGIALDNAHNAAADALAACAVLHKLLPLVFKREPGKEPTLSEVLHFVMVEDANEWQRFNEWVAQQP
jgi:DNA polymerase-3 subunit epsilon